MVWCAEKLKKRLLCYFLEHYAGWFLQEKLTLEQLSIDLYNGKGSVCDVSLDVNTLNEIGSTHNLPFEFIEGFVENISVSIPWASLSKENCNVEIYGLMITVQPKPRTENASSIDSMFESMSTSLQMTEEFLKQDLQNEDTLQLEGYVSAAKRIETELRRMKIKLVNTTIRIEHIPKNRKNGIALEIRIKCMDYFDEAGEEISVAQSKKYSFGLAQEYDKETLNMHEPSSISTKVIWIDGTSFHSDEFVLPSGSNLSPSSIHSSSSSPEAKNSEVFRTAPVSPENNDKYFEFPKSSEPSESNPIKIAQFVGKQEIRLKFTENENISDAKVGIDLKIPSLVSFLSPRQMHLLHVLLNSFIIPVESDKSNADLKQKQMELCDYQRVQMELQNQLNQVEIAGDIVHHQHGWSSHPLENSDDEFLPVATESNLKMQFSQHSNMESSVTSITSNTTASSYQTDQNFPNFAHRSRSRSKGHLHNLIDENVETTRFNIELNNFSLILLHEDIIALSSDGNYHLSQPSVNLMKTTSQQFFDKAGLMNHSFDDVDNANAKFSKLCQANHLRILASSIIIHGKEMTETYSSQLHMNIEIINMNVLECLFDRSLVSSSKNTSSLVPEYVELLVFKKPTMEFGKKLFSSKSKALKIEICQIKKLRSQKRKIKSPSNKPGISIHVSLDDCRVEFDITLMDRIHALFQMQSFTDSNEHSSFNFPEEVEDNSHRVKSDETSFEITCPSLEVNIRFPIPDLRPLHDMNRLPWWKRSIRSDILTLELKHFIFNTTFNNSSLSQYELMCEEVLGYFKESVNEPAINFLRASSDSTGCSMLSKGFDLPRLVLKIKPSVPVSVLDGIIENDSTPPQDSLDVLVNSFKNEELSPFISKRVLFQNDRKTNEQSSNEDSLDEEEMVMPAEKSNLNDFIESAMHNSSITVEISLPNLNVQFPNKHIYEVIYNRISNDLLLWEPAAPHIPQPNCNPHYSLNNFQPVGLDLASQFLQKDLEKFSVCRSVRYESSSDSDEFSGTYFSTVEMGKRKKKKRQENVEKSTKPKQHNLSIQISTSNGELSACCPLRGSDGNVVPSHHGKMTLKVQDASAFILSGYGCEKQHGYITVQANKASLYHKGLMKTASFDNILGPVTVGAPQNLDEIIYKLQSGAFPKHGENIAIRANNEDMLSVSVKFQRQKNSLANEKCFKVAFKLNFAALRHQVINSSENWLNQLMDFFDVVDYPVAGYTCPPIITELHLYVSKSAIDYRPLNLPLRCFITLDTFSISSNIAPQTSTSILRFICEDACLFISNKCKEPDVDLANNYVCVMDIGFFELSLKLSNSKNSDTPFVDLQASNNMLHIRTCADSVRALCDLITYFATDGDLDSEQSSDSNAQQNYDAPVVSTSVSVESNLSKSQEDKFKDMMAEAMTDICDLKEDSVCEKKIRKNSSAMMSSDDEENLEFTQKIKSDRHIDIYCSSEEQSDDEDFCILENDPGVGISPKGGNPLVRTLISGPLNIVNNHFSVPVGKADILRAPKHFPTPVYRYSLREMSVIWHMYGGQDLTEEGDGDEVSSESSHPESPATSSLFTGNNFSEPSVGFSKAAPQEIYYAFNESEVVKSQKNIITEGGPNRNTSVLMELQMNKVRFQYETYPEDTEQASRQVLMIHDVELRDRLASSQINKFLYQYTSESMPRQHLAQMIMIKAIHIRPDPNKPTQECQLKVSILPLRLNIDQDALFFLYGYFSEIAVEKSSSASNASLSSPAKKATAPVMNVTNNDQSCDPLSPPEQPQKVILQEESIDTQNLVSPLQENKTQPKPPVFFRSFMFSPPVPIRLDYHGKRVDMDQGALAGLIIGLTELNSSEFVLKAIDHRHGLLGTDRLLQYSLNEWITDIRKSQLPSLLVGIGPMHSIVQLFQGIKDLIWLPIEQYNKDGRIVRGLQRGANSFSTSTAMATLELTNRVVETIQGAAQIAYIMLSPNANAHECSPGPNRRYPADIREGVTCAYDVIREGLGDTARAVYKVAKSEHERKGMTGAVGGVIRQFPPTLVKPIIIATEATSNVLGGMKNQLVPDARREAAEKWRANE